MSTTSSSSSGSRPTSRNYDTGFPDSFASRTTSMRHPDAIIDPDFAICSEHIDPAKTLQRSLMSLLRKHRRTMSSAKSIEGTLGRVSTDHRSSSSAADATYEQSHDTSAGIAQPLNVHMDHLNPIEAAEKALGISSHSDSHHADDSDLQEGEDRRRSKIFWKLMSKN
ncbi:hypothetical protein F4861DRAFT_272164 [Xylaria intraflava]|nr:hypothetical protein F4861DRAFT_272164 [Xylaria intraflava]